MPAPPPARPAPCVRRARSRSYGPGRAVAVRLAAGLVTLAAVVFLGAAPALAATGPGDHPEEAPAYRPPVDAPVLDPFRAPEHPFGPGNRGLEYDTNPGDEVVAAAAGTVTFAGPVAGSRHVTVLHDDGVRTTYAFLASVLVAEGQRVEQGIAVGTAGERLHFSARVDDAYIDPALLFAAADAASVRLVPHDVALGTPEGAAAAAPGSPPASVFDAVLDRLGVDDGLAALGASAIDWLRAGADSALTAPARITEVVTTAMLSPFGQHVSQLVAAPGVAWLRSPVEEWWRRRTDCTPPEAVPPVMASRRVAVLVGGLGSSSDAAAITELDTTALGYDAADVVRFSYAGGVVPGTDGAPRDPGALGAIGSSEYQPEDTMGDLRVAGARLAEVLWDVAAAAPGVPIDVIAHSQGGVVARLAITEVVDGAGAAGVAVPVRTVVTLGTPHQGADLATLVSRVADRPGGTAMLEAVQALSGLEIDPGAPALAQLSESSDLMASLGAQPLPAGVEVVSVAARGDVVVPAPRSHLDGATNVVVAVAGLATDHDRLPGAPAAAREVALALAGLAPSCEGLLEALADHIGGAAIGAVEELIGLVPVIGPIGAP